MLLLQLTAIEPRVGDLVELGCLFHVCWQHSFVVRCPALDAFSLHHPFLRSHVTEFEFSAWYFLFFSIFYKNSSVTETVDVSLVVPDLASALSSKLSVPASVFSVSKAEKYRSLKITFH